MYSFHDLASFAYLLFVPAPAGCAFFFGRERDILSPVKWTIRSSRPSHHNCSLRSLAALPIVAAPAINNPVRDPGFPAFPTAPPHLVNPREWEVLELSAFAFERRRSSSDGQP